MKTSAVWLGVLLCIGLAGCGPGTEAHLLPAPDDLPGMLRLSSPAFAEGDAIPDRYTCQGEDISPPLVWSSPPEEVRSFALLMDDPDGGDWVHWIVLNLPATATSLPEGVPNDSELPDGSRQGKNSWGRIGWGGPCPPSGTHRYIFRLYALDTTLDVEASLSRSQLLTAMEGHVLDQAEYSGRFTKQ